MASSAVPDMTMMVSQARSWLKTWSGFVAAVDTDSARALFDSDVIGYGTRANEARGLDVLVAEQWSHVWPNIDDFAFDHEGAEVWVSPDGCQAVLGCSWDSQGRNADGTRFPRGGRATIVLRRDDATHDWYGIHTHVSRRPDDPGTYIAPAR